MSPRADWSAALASSLHHVAAASGWAPGWTMERVGGGASRLCIALALAGGCGPAVDPADSDDPIALRCSDTVAGAFAMLTTGKPIATGVCGHAVVETGGADLLVADDLRTLSQLGHVTESVFAPTGHLLAYAVDDALVLHDLEAEEATGLGARPQRFAFVASADAERGAWLVACDEGTLVRHDGDGATTTIASAVDCSQLASGGRRVVVFDDADRLLVVDPDAASVKKTSYVRTHGSSELLQVAPDGALALHEVRETESCGGCDFEEEVTVASAVVDLGTGALQSETGDRNSGHVLVGATGHLVRGHDDAGSFLLDDGTRMDLGDNDGLWFSPDATHAFIEIDGAIDRLERLDIASGATTTIAELDTITEVAAAPSGSVVAIAHWTDECAELEQAGECARTLATLRLWREDGGLGEPLIYGIAFEIDAVLDDGRALVTAELWQDGVLAPGSAWIAADGTVLSQWLWPTDEPSAKAMAIGASTSGFVFATGKWDERVLQIAGADGESHELGAVGEVRDATVIDLRDGLYARIDDVLFAGGLGA